MTAPASATSTPAQIANEQAKRLQESSNKIRERAETSAKALSAFGAAALGAAGLSKITDLFPLPADGPTATVGVSAAILGFVMIALSLLLFTRGIWKINRAIVTSTKLEECGPDLDASEKKIFEGEYEKTVALNRAAWALDADASLADYEQRGLEKQSAALGQDEPLRRRPSRTPHRSTPTCEKPRPVLPRWSSGRDRRRSGRDLSSRR